MIPLAAVSVLVAGAALTGRSRQRDASAGAVLNSSTGETCHRWDAQAVGRCGKRLGVTVEQQSVPAAQVMTEALRMASSNGPTAATRPTSPGRGSWRRWTTGRAC